MFSFVSNILLSGFYLFRFLPFSEIEEVHVGTESDGEAFRRQRCEEEPDPEEFQLSCLGGKLPVSYPQPRIGVLLLRGKRTLAILQVHELLVV